MAQQDRNLSTLPLVLLLRVNGLQNWRRLKALRHQSWLLNGVILVFLIGYVALSFWLFLKGLRFVAAFPGLGPVLTERLLYLLFAFLFGLLLLSNLVIGYTNLFRNREATFLLTLPCSWQTIFRWKFVESTILASWAFLFLIAPLLAAFGMSRGAAWHFYLVTIIMVGLFIVLPGVAGSWIAVCLARYLDRRGFQILAGLIILLVIIGGAVWWKAQPTTDEILESRVLEMLDQMLVKTRFAQFPFLPSYWLTSSVLEWTEGALRASGFFMLVLLSHVAFFGCISFTRFGILFYDSASAAFGRPKLRFQWGFKGPTAISLTESIWNRLLVIPADVRALILKDARTFWRDTAQWGQTIMLFGLLTVYIANLRHFTHQ